MDARTRRSRAVGGTAASLAAVGLLTLGSCSSLRQDAPPATGSANLPVPAIRPQQSVLLSPPLVVPSQHLDLASEALPESKARLELAWGHMLESAGKLAEATAFYEDALRQDPKSLNVMLALARNYSQLGRPQAAMEIYHRATKQHPKNPAVHNNMGLHLAEQKDWPEALAALRKAVKLDPLNSKYHNNVASVLASAGDYEAAWEEFRAAVGPATAHYNVGFMLACAGQTKQARKHLEQSIRLKPDLQQAKNLLAMLDRRSGSAPGGGSSPPTGQPNLKVMPAVLVPELVELSSNGDADLGERTGPGSVAHSDTLRKPPPKVHLWIGTRTADDRPVGQ